MEAATPLPFAQVAIRNGRLAIDALVVDDETAVRLASESADPARFVIDALGVGARVLDREQTTAQSDLVKAEFDRLKTEFGERLNTVFSPDEGHVSRIMAKHFGDESSVSVQQRLRAVMNEVSGQIREDVRKQFTSDSQDNPIVAIQRATLKAMRESSEQQATLVRSQIEQQATTSRTMAERIEALTAQVAALKAQKEKLEEVALEAERGTAKGRTYEELVAESLDAIATAQGDDCDAVGDVKGVGGKKGDIVVALDACAGPARGRIVFEAKNSQLSKNKALADLDEAMAARDADYAILVVPSADKLPARTTDLREFGGNKLFVVFDPDEGLRVGLEVAYKLARARVLMSRGDEDAIDPAAVRAEVERAVRAMEDVRRVKSQLTQATTYIGEAQKIIDTMAANVRGHLGQVDALLRPAADAEPEPVE